MSAILIGPFSKESDCIAPLGNSLRLNNGASPQTSKEHLELRLFTKVVGGFQGLFKAKSS